HWLTYFRDSIKANDPSDTTMDFQTLANANLASTCNAFYDGSSVNFYSSGGGCVNTAYSDVVLHETGHWANEQYNGAVTGAFHEGNADGFAYHFNDDSCLTDLDGVGCLRSGTQVAVKKCPTDGDESCHGGEVHNEGQVMGSANWAVRSRLETTLGAGPGGLLATALFLGWMQTYNDGAILNVIEDHWLALDDDNADMSDLTPHFGDINAGFKDYNWPGFPDLTISSIGGPADNSAVGHLAAVGVTANIVAIVGSVSTATLKYSTGGAFSNVTMTPTGNPNQYQGVIPGLASPNTVKWYIDATSSTGGHAVGPAGAPENVRIYHVGQVTVLNSWTFDGGTDESWTHANLSGTNGDQWQRGNPAGSAASTDPHAAFSPNNVWGTDLSLAATDGMYEPSSSGELRSPTLNYS
ncbi:MAG TPA: hypothetical protein PLV92_26615, partial [Pirellulaceae bacterium]|nr:hypothetical protein [Pirellulaceae bacterium]